MASMQRRLAYQTGMLGVALTLAVIFIDAAGLLDPLERWLYDLRARQCQVFSPAPTNRLYHLDIDDQSLAQLGRWPWPRAVQAQLIDEIRLAGSSIIALDILLDAPQKVETVEDSNGRIAARIDHDQ